ncbi:hypothetical protein GE09DRAFT_454622 [Coniochaeta sp. 2T2.1]|nr:hypothetical protein GE09DRAFT_454622 [Coniochaeta sp. 2T2.1]
MVETGLLVAAIGVVIVFFWLYRINRAMKSVPREAYQAAPRGWTRQQVHVAYEAVKANPIEFGKHLSPRLRRRYVIVGGSGHIGCEIVAQLLQRGHPPVSIRILDFRPPTRPDMLQLPGSQCDYAEADITSPDSVKRAFTRPWHGSVAGLPLTVMHTAAALRFHERSPLVYHRCRRVNVDGTASVLSAAREAGADIFIATSSASIAMTPVRFWIWPWESEPANYVQTYGESDFDAPLRPHERFFGNYGLSKATAERLVCGANAEGFRTGVIRPGNAVYGQMGDQLVGSLLQQSTIVSWFPHVRHNFVSGRNVALAHLQMEAALARPEMPLCAGRPFNVTDPNPPLAFLDLYNAISQLSAGPVSMAFPPPVVPLMVAHLVEAWCLLLARWPFLTDVLAFREPVPPLLWLQPSVFTASSHSIVNDSAARRSVEEGGLGYGGVCTTLEGFCELMLCWNRDKAMSLNVRHM